MRRLGLIALALLGAAAWWVTSSAGASDSHTYRIEMYNAFGIVNGSDVRIGGVNAGSVSGLDINAKKRAVVTVSLSGPLSVLGKDTHCASEPQSLIAEYFIDCTPKGPPLADNGEIPASRVRMTVQNDLVLNTLRTSYRDRLGMLINEFGTALAGNAHSLNQAIRLGSPALFNLRKVLDILARQNTTIRDLNVNSDRIIGKLADNRANVIKFIKTAGRTAAASAAQREDLSVDFDRLDNFLAQLGPTTAQLRQTAIQSTPLLSDLHAAAPGLNTLAVDLPPFNRSANASLHATGQAAVPGRKVVKQGRDEIQALKRAGVSAQPVADMLAKFLLDLDSPSRAINVDARAANTCPAGTPQPKTQPCYSTGRAAPTGYDGMESLLNYVYYQAGALNQFDQVGHQLHVSLYNAVTGPCGNFSSGHDPTTGAPGVPSKTGGKTTDITQTDPCVSWLGPNQPGINEDLHLPPYDPSVCPNGTTPAAALVYCNPAGTAAKPSSKAGAFRASGQTSGGAGASGPTAGSASSASPSAAGTASGGGSGSAAGSGAGGQGPVPNLPPGVVPHGGNALQNLDHVLGLAHGGGGGANGSAGGPGGGAGGVVGGTSGSPPAAPGGSGTAGATQSILDYLLGG
jgi:phospholipid/cholesterol/gamma-HCH transport system substrate-binding protein